MEQTYGSLIAWLQTENGSPFKSTVWSNFSPLGMLSEFLNLIAYGIGSLFKIFLDGMNTVAIEAYKFLSFSGSDSIKNLYNVLSKYIWIPVLLCGMIMCIRVVMGDIVKKNVGKQFIRNIGYLFIAIAVLPTVFSYMNTYVIDENYFTKVSLVDSDNSMSDNILRTNATDRLWLYEYMVNYTGYSDLKNLDEKIGSWDTGVSFGDVVSYIFGGDPSNSNCGGLDDKTSVTLDDVHKIIDKLNSSDAHKMWLTGSATGPHKNNEVSDIAKQLSFDDWLSVRNRITEFTFNDWNNNSQTSTNQKYSGGVPNFFKVKTSTHTETAPDGSTVKIQQVMPMSDGTDILGITISGNKIGKESYWRYDIDWFNVYVELIAHAYVAFVVAYCAIKLIIELIVHQVFGGIMAAMDLTGGERIKKYFTAIIGCYMGLLIGAMVLPIYNAGCSWITTHMQVESTFVKVILEIILAMVVVNIPNIIAMYFGVNTGAGGGMALFGAGAYLAGRAGRAVAKTGVGAARGIRNAVQTGAFTQRGRQLDMERLQEARHRQGQENQRRQEQKHDAERAEDKQESAARESARQQENTARESVRQQKLEQQNAASNEQNALRSNQDPNALAMERNADIANGRVPRTYDPVTYEKDQRMNSDILKGAQENGGTREAAKESASKYYSNHGVPSGVTPQTIEYTADKAYLHGQWDSINKEAKSMVDLGQARSYNEARVQVATNKLQEWGGTKENAERYVSEQISAEQLIPQRQNNSNLKT